MSTQRLMGWECVTRFQTSSFFHDSNPSGPMINKLKYFRIQFRNPGNILKNFKLWCASTAESDSAVYIIPRCQTPSDEKFSKMKKLCGVQLTAESSSAVCIIQRSLTPRCASVSHCRVNNLSSVCFNPKFYKCFFSVMPKVIHMKLIF